MLPSFQQMHTHKEYGKIALVISFKVQHVTQSHPSLNSTSTVVFFNQIVDFGVEELLNSLIFEKT